ncbi:MAG: penicillin-binding protein activator [Alphaproteobacteria bacterium]|nr:penicillin-binding protein activator [Alphaproteobacteria bacterium]
MPAQPPQAEAKKPSQTQQTFKKPAEYITPAPAPTPAPVIGTAPVPQQVIVESAPTLKPPSGIEGQPTRIGLLLPLSGPSGATELGQAMLNAAMLALFDIGGQRLLLMPRDTGGTPHGAVQAAAELVGEGAEIILGPLFNTSVEAAAVITQSRGVPMISFSSDRRVAGDGVYILSFTPSQEVGAVIGFAAARGLHRIAALLPDDLYGLAVLDAMREAVERHGAELARAEFYSPDGEELDKSVKRLGDYHARRQALLSHRKELEASASESSKLMLEALKKHDTMGELDFDAVLLPEGGELLKSLAPLLPYYDIDTTEIRLLGTGRWDDPKLRLEPALIGGWFAGADRAAAISFRNRYKAVYGQTPPRLASLAFDAMALAAVLGQEAGGPDFTNRAITNPDGFVGSDGIFRFGPDGVAQRGMAVLEIERDGFRVRQKAPSTFEALTN